MEGKQTSVIESSDGDIKKLVASAVPESTKKSPKYAVNVFDCEESHGSRLLIFMHQSIPAVPIPPPPPAQLRGICLRCQSRGWGIHNFIAARGLGISVPRGDPRAFDTTCFRKMVEFIGKDEAFVEDWFVRQGLEKLVDVFKDTFPQF